MGIGDLKTDKGIKDLNSYLADHSYIEGWQPTQADVVILEALGKTPTSSNPHVLRWYNHIKSYDLKTLPGEKKAPIILGSNNTATGKNEEDDDKDVDLFESDEEEDPEAIRLREERLREYAEKKSKKPILIAKSSVVLDVKPWDDETDMKAIEEIVRSIQMDGLTWAASKLVAVGYGIHKFRIMCIIEDDKVSVDSLIEQIESFEEYVQSVDIESFNKL
ncbi:elongation factor 1-beta' [Apis florea]|uniref:elongation factor 1-beta' n=1 Tax=Apis florea TaxID=7463 RepID=UPI0006297762|nr:elongation factor 1-beta' [Apis florea]